jgi:hypothetical protein
MEMLSRKEKVTTEEYVEQDGKKKNKKIDVSCRFIFLFNSCNNVRQCR